MLTRSLREIRHQISNRIGLFPGLLGRTGLEQKTQPALRDWIEALPIDQPQICCERVFARLPSLAAIKLSNEERLDLLERISEQLAPVLGSLESDSCAGAIDCGQMAERLLIRLSEAYATLIFARGVGLRYSAPDRNTRLAALRCAQFAYRRTVLASRLHLSLGSEYWMLATRLYLYARDAHFHDAILDEQTSDTVSRSLTRILLLVLADPQTLSADQIEQTRFYIERYGQLARITPAKEWTGDDEGWFLLWPSDGALLPMLGSRQVQPEVIDRLLLDTHPLLSRLDIQREELASGNSPTRLGLPRNARDEDYQHLLDKLRQKWSHPHQRQTRRYPQRPLATVIVGFDAVRKALKLRPQPGVEEEELHGEDWEITDRSTTGLRIELPSAAISRTDIGELIGLAAHDGSGLSLAVARRARRRYNQNQELGLELLGNGIAVRYTPAPDEDNSSPAPIPLIFLPEIPRLGNAPGLLAPLDEVAPGTELNLPLHGQHIRLETAARIERFAHCELIRLSGLGAQN